MTCHARREYSLSFSLLHQSSASSKSEADSSDCCISLFLISIRCLSIAIILSLDCSGMGLLERSGVNGLS